MADILVKIDSIQGESTILGYQRQIHCDSVSHAIDLPVLTKGSVRAEGASYHGTMELTHKLDCATPFLKYAASSRASLGTAVITKLRTMAGEPKPVEIVTLQQTYVVRVEINTPIDYETGYPSDVMTETFSLRYGAITWKYNLYEDGFLRDTVRSGWSIAEGRLIA